MSDNRTLNEVAETFEIISEEAVFDVNSADEWAKKIQDGIKAPHVGVQKTTLGGANRVSLMITLSLDPKSEWKNGIFHNSRYAHVRLENTGELEMFAISGFGYKKAKAMRKTSVKAPEEAIKKINAWIDSVKDVKGESFDSETEINSVNEVSLLGLPTPTVNFASYYKFLSDIRRQWKDENNEGAARALYQFDIHLQELQRDLDDLKKRSQEERKRFHYVGKL